MYSLRPTVQTNLCQNCRSDISCRGKGTGLGSNHQQSAGEAQSFLQMRFGTDKGLILQTCRITKEQNTLFKLKTAFNFG